MASGRRLPSSIWLVPLAAAVTGVALAGSFLADRGPAVTIGFSTAEGLEAGRSKVKYRNVDVGSVTSIRVSRNRAGVLVDVRLTAAAKALAVADTRFWIVRPRIGLTGVSDLGTALSGAYIAADLGKARAARTAFTGLDAPPAVESGRNGRRYVLHAASLGSADIGSPIYHRRVRVGQVTGYSLDADGAGVTIDAFVDAPFDRYVGVGSRWWQAGGIDLRLDAGGLTLGTQSVAAMIAGGLAFASPPDRPVATVAPDGAHFGVADGELDAMHAPQAPPAPVVMKFDRSLRGLSVGAPVDFRGIELGSVTAVGTEYDPVHGDVAMRVTMHLFPDRLGPRYREALGNGDTEAGKALLRELVARGLRGQLRVGNLLTNRLYVALDLFPNAPAARVDLTRAPIELPTVPNTLDALQVQIADIVGKLSRMPVDEIGTNLNDALRSANHLFAQLHTSLAPQARDTLATARQAFDAAQATLQQDSPLQADLHDALTQLARTARTLNALADYVERHPDALLRGKPSDAQR